MCTAPTPAASGAKASSSFGIIPPWTVPSAIAARASATVSRARREAGSSLSRRTPPTAVQATRAPRLDCGGQLAGDDVGVDVQDLARPRRAPRHATTGTEPAASSASSSAQSKPSTSPTKPKSTGAPSEPDTDARRAPVRADDAARSRQPDGRHARAAQGRARDRRSVAGDDHLHDVQRRRVGDAPAADQARLDPQLARQLGRLRPAAVNDDQPAALGRARARSAATAARAGPARTSPPHLTTASRLRPRTGVLERRRLGHPQHQVHVLDRLPGAALDQVVGRADDGGCSRRARPAAPA